MSAADTQSGRTAPAPVGSSHAPLPDGPAGAAGGAVGSAATGSTAGDIDTTRAIDNAPTKEHTDSRNTRPADDNDSNPAEIPDTNAAFGSEAAGPAEYIVAG